ncbi:MAG TPA: CapA family protein [Thermomicrobiales bacterium]|nr:CapA family protein [Thermomicrobiales bacterium]
MSRRRFVAALASAGAGILAACSGPSEQRPASRYDRDVPTRAPNSPDSFPTPTGQIGGTSSQIGQPIGPSSTPDSSPTSGNQPGTATTITGATVTTPTGFAVTIDPDLPAHLQPQADRLRDQLAADPSLKAAGQLVISTIDNPADGTAVYPVDFVPVVSRRLLVRNITIGELEGLWKGDITDWSALGSPVPHGVVRVTLESSAGPFAKDKAAGDFPTVDALADYFIQERGALALIPLDQLDFRFRALNIDDVNVLRPGDKAWPLRSFLTVTPQQTLDTATANALTTALAPTLPAPVSMTWAGDIIIARQVQRRILETGDWAAPFRSIYPELTWADITISNLETSLSDSFESITDPTTFTFKTDTPAIEGLQLAQIDVLSRANNHSFNYGDIGMNDTTAVLDAAGIKHFGMGNNLDEARRAVVVEQNGVTFAFLGYNGISDDWDAAGPNYAGTAPLVDWMVVEDIKREVAAGHIVIPYFHWGIEYQYDPTEEQRYFAQTAIDTGAAVVMGSHPHWVQAVETYKGRPILYSLGNFVFDQEWSLETKQGMIAHLWMQGDKPLKIDIVPVLIEDYHRPRVMTIEEQWLVLEHVWAASDWIIQNG